MNFASREIITMKDNKVSAIYDCNNPQLGARIERKNLPRKTLNDIRMLHRLDVRYNWFALLFTLLWGIAAYTMLVVDSILIQIACFIIIACCITALPILMHEACHSLLSKNRNVNRWLGFLCGLPGLVAVSAYRSIHLVHHATTKTSEDPDNIEVSAKSVPLVIVYYVVLFIGIYIYIFTVPIVGYQKAKQELRKYILVEYGLLLAVVMLLFYLFPAKIILAVWIYPLLLAAQLSNVRGLAEHGMTTGGNAFTDTRTVVSNRFVSFFMCNLNYHLEHHLFPGIPWYRLPEVHRLLQEEYRRSGSSVYRSYTRFLLDFFRVTLKGVVPNVRLIPAHIREEICL